MSKFKLNINIDDFNDDTFTIKYNNLDPIKLKSFKMGGVSLNDIILHKSELSLIDFFIKNKKNYNRIADIGANFGLHSIILSQLYKEVEAFEPYNLHYNFFSHLIRLNKIKNIKLNKKAVAEKSGKMKFIIMQNNTTANNLVSAKRTLYGKMKKIDVNCVSFNKAINKCDLVKIDVEGYESKLFSSLNIKNYNNKTDFIIEIHNKFNALRLFNFVNKSQVFKMFKIKGTSLIKINSYRTFPKNTKDGHLFLKSI